MLSCNNVGCAYKMCALCVCSAIDNEVDRTKTDEANSTVVVRDGISERVPALVCRNTIFGIRCNAFIPLDSNTIDRTASAECAKSCPNYSRLTMNVATLYSSAAYSNGKGDIMQRLTKSKNANITASQMYELESLRQNATPSTRDKFDRVMNGTDYNDGGINVKCNNTSC